MIVLGNYNYHINVCIYYWFSGANVNSYNTFTGANALHIAIESEDTPQNFEKLLRCLLDYKIDMNATALTGDTALNRALLLQR